MKTLRDSLICCLLTCLIVAAYCGALLVRAATVTTAAVPQEIADTRAALTAQVAALRIDALAEIDKQANGLRAELHGDVRLVDRQLSAITGQLDKRTGDMLTRVDTALGMVDLRTGQALTTVAGIRTDLAPALANAAALVKDAQDSWDDSYDDVRGLLDSSEVAVTQAAQTMQTINKAAAPTLAAEQKTADAVAASPPTCMP
jgi:hypothetical protein